jgi:dicarboxylate/amino acid:cation (Na+ or H+) symporter, DAACS family
MPEPTLRRRPLHTRILAGLILGATCGSLANILIARHPEFQETFYWTVSTFIEPVGQIFLRMLFMIVVPLVFASLTLGVAALGNFGRLGRIGLMTFTYFIIFTALAATLGLTLVNFLKPGAQMDPATREELLAAYTRDGEVATPARPSFGIDNFVQIVPRNPVEAAARGDMLAVIFFSLITGIALSRVPKEHAEPLLKLLQGVGKVVEVVIDFAMRLAPYGVFALIFSVTSRFGWDFLRQLLFYVVVALVGMVIFEFVVYGVLIKLLAKRSPLDFFRRIRVVMITAFSTSSSAATLPTTMKTAQNELGVPPHIAGFVLPLGATMNMNGTSLFEGMTVMFLAQVWGINLGIGDQILVMVLCVLTAIGTAGIPGGSIPLLVLILQTLGIPAEGIALILGIDRILDMSRTVVNVTGDLTAAAAITRFERTQAPSTLSPDLSPEDAGTRA